MPARSVPGPDSIYGDVLHVARDPERKAFMPDCAHAIGPATIRTRLLRPPPGNAPAGTT